MTQPNREGDEPATETAVRADAEFPKGLFEWAGHKAGGVRRMFYNAYGRPSGQLIETPLLARLREWSDALAAETVGTPRIVLLAGGPGNGKTEAVEEAIRALEAALALDGQISTAFAAVFNPRDGSTVPRKVELDVRTLGSVRPIVLTLVQDASVRDSALHDLSPAELLVRDLEQARVAGKGNVYMACVNRGILDDALIAARARHGKDVTELLEMVIKAVGVGLATPTCWPLEKFPDVAIWPMDVESLLAASGESASPGSQALTAATDPARWPQHGACAAGERCPFCTSRKFLTGEPHRDSFLRILRFYELASGKRWSFRDLFSLLSYLLAGSPEDDAGANSDPCSWAAKLIDLDQRQVVRPEPTKLMAPFLLVAAQYQHALFGTWPKVRRTGIRELLKDLQLLDNPTLLGFHHFLTGSRRKSVPGTLQSELMALCHVLDPALSNPDLQVEVSGRTAIALREIDTRFSHGVREGYDYIRKYHCLGPNELDLLRRLADADDQVGSPEVRRRKPTSASKVQVLLRDFASRLVRRSLGCRTAVVRDVTLLDDFASVIAGDQQLALQSAKQVEGLLNDEDRFVVTLNNTFGEAPPPEARRVVLETPRQKVRPTRPQVTGRPMSDQRFLTLGANANTQPIALTYDLFRSVHELQEGMLEASLPRGVIAALDAARAKLAGKIVRDEEALDGAEITIGNRPERIARELGQFIVRTES